MTIRNGMDFPPAPSGSKEVWKPLVGLGRFCCISRPKDKLELNQELQLIALMGGGVRGPCAGSCPSPPVPSRTSGLAVELQSGSQDAAEGAHFSHILVEIF